MADEEEVVVEKSSGGGIGGLIPLITLVLIVVSIGVSAFSLITVLGIKSSMTAMSEDAVEEEALDSGTISVLEIDTFDFSKQFILRYPDEEDSSLTNTVVVNIKVGIYSTEDNAEEATALKDLMTTKESIIRDGLETLMKTEKFDDFVTEEGQGKIKADILNYLQDRLVTDLIIDIYFNDMVTQTS